MGMTYDCTDEELIAFIKKIVKAQKINQMLDEDTESTWKELGEKLLKCRIGLGLHRQEVADKMGCSAMVVKRLEEGLPLRDRKWAKDAYKNALNNIYYERAEWIKKLDEIENDNNSENEKNDL